MGMNVSEEKYDVLSNISHGVRTPIHTIMGMTDLALEETDNSEAVEGYLKKIKSASYMLINQINDLLDITKIEREKIDLHLDSYTAAELKKQIKNLIEALSDTLANSAYVNKKIDFEVNVDNLSSVNFWADKVRFEQIFSNLLSNAIKYTPDGGKVSFVAETLHGTEQEITNRYTISDNGIGISNDFMKYVFQPFMREKNDVTDVVEGTGLGLYIVKQLVDLMQGSIKIWSEEGKGTVVTVEIPSRICTIVKSTHIEDTKVPVIVTGKRILLCEDNELNAEMTKELLEDAGIIVEEVSNGRDAVLKVKNNLEYYYDAILMDICMPVMDGLEATRQIRKLDREDTYLIPIIAMTASAYEEEYRKSIAAGMDAHLTKPFEVSTLIHQLARFWQVYQQAGNENNRKNIE